MEGILLTWVIFLVLITSTVWLIKQLDSEPASTNQVTTQETVAAITAEIVALVPVATPKQSKQKRGRRIPRPHTPDDCAMCRHEGVDTDNDDVAIAEAERIRRVIPYSQL